VPIIERYNERRHLSTITLSGSVAMRDLEAHNDHRLAQRLVRTADCLWCVEPGAEFADMTIEKLDAYGERLRALYRSAPLPLARRLAWLCRSERALPFVQHFLRNRAPDDGLYALPRLVDSIAQAAQWLMVPEDDLVETLTRGAVVAAFPGEAPTAAA
jgi:hypothetical protein